MASHKVEDIRNIALAGHGASGKTSLADALLYQAKAVDRQGSVDDGTSTSDHDEEEHKRHFSIDSSVLHLTHQGKRLNLIDTPGYPDFVGAALGALNAVENVAIVVSATAGVQVNTRRMFAEAGKRGLARLLVLNKLDGENIKFDAILSAIEQTFGAACVLFNAPSGVGAAFESVVSVVTPPASPPAGCPVDLEKARTKLIDAVVSVDDELAMEYLDKGDLSTEQLLKAMPVALAAGKFVPIFCTSARQGVGIAELLDGLAALALPPTALPRTATKKQGAETTEIKLSADPAGEFVGQVFKTISDKFVGTLSFLRVYSGTYSADQPLVNARTEKGSRAGGLFEMQGKQNTPVPQAIAGDIVAVTKVEDLHIGDTVSNHPHAPKLPPLSYPTPMFGLAVQPKARGDEQKISTSLAKVANEDPTFRVTRDTQTHEMVMTGMSQLHLDVVQNRLKRRFDLEVVTHEPKVPYRETIQVPSEGNHRHKKQTGGRGQFGEVHLRAYPLPREITSAEQFFEEFANKDRFEKLRLDHCRYEAEHNFGFVDSVVGGTIPNQFVPACEKGCKELLERGALAGYRIQDVCVEIYFGKDHPVDSSEAAFKTAARIAFKNAFLAGKPVLLEPIVDLEVTIPSQYFGAIQGDLSTRRARIEDQDSLPGDLLVIKAKAPLSEVMRYAAQLGSITQGQGSYSMEFSHYEVVPGNVQQQIVSKAKLAADEDE